MPLFRDLRAGYHAGCDRRNGVETRALVPYNNNQPAEAYPVTPYYDDRQSVAPSYSNRLPALPQRRLVYRRSSYNSWSYREGWLGTRERYYSSETEEFYWEWEE